MKFLLSSILVGMSLCTYAQTWTSLSCGSSAEVHRIDFPAIDTGYVSLNNNTLRRTSNSGANWSPCTVPANSMIQIDFVTGQRGCMIQANGISLTTDGAQSWTSVLMNPSLDFYDVFFANANVGFASALNSNLDSLYIFQTTNSGSNWNLLSVHSGPYNIFYPELYFISTSIGFTTFDAGILKTTDGGVTWSVVFTDPNTDVWNSMSSPDGITIRGGGMLGWLYESSNSGSSWTSATQLTYPGYGMYFSTPTHGFYCGGNGFGSGAIEETNNGGTTWTPVHTGNSFWCIDFPASNRGYVGGTNGVVVRYDGGPLSVEENATPQVSIYPNPTDDFVILRNTALHSTITITNCIGEIVLTAIASETQTTIDLSNLPPGIYLCKISEEANTETHRIVLQ